MFMCRRKQNSARSHHAQDKGRVGDQNERLPLSRRVGVGNIEATRWATRASGLYSRLDGARGYKHRPIFPTIFPVSMFYIIDNESDSAIIYLGSGKFHRVRWREPLTRCRSIVVLDTNEVWQD